MSDRITRANLDERLANLNRRMQNRGADVSYQIQGRNGYYGLDRYDGAGEVCRSLVRIGTKSELGEFLHAMMVALDDAEIYAETTAQ